MTMNNERVIWDLLKKEGFNDFGIAGLMGNIEAESNGNPNNLQNIGNVKLGVTDEEFTQALDNGRYSRDTFIHDGYGYGICQWTWFGRKEYFYDFMKRNFESFADIRGQVDYMLWELRTSYKECYNTLMKATSIREATEIILKKYESPADQSEKMILKRTAYAGAIYDRMTANKNTDYNKDEAIKLIEQALTLLRG